MGNRHQGEVRRRQDAIKSLLWQEIEKSEIVDAIIISNLPGKGPSLHIPESRANSTPPTIREMMLAVGQTQMTPPGTADEQRRATQFRESVRHTVTNDIKAISDRLTAQESLMLPIAREVYVQQQADLYRQGRSKFVGRNTDPRLAAAGGDIAMKASVNIATARKVDTKGTKKIEIDVGERIAKASRAGIAEKWRRIRAEQPKLMNRDSLKIIDVSVMNREVAVVTDEDTD